MFELINHNHEILFKYQKMYNESGLPHGLDLKQQDCCPLNWIYLILQVVDGRECFVNGTSWIIGIIIFL